MSKTMSWRLLPQLACIVVHGEHDPSDAEWDEYLAAVMPSAGQLKGLLVYSIKGGPSAKQRGKSNKLYEEHGLSFNSAVMTNSRITRGIVTAFSWVMGGAIAAFTLDDLDGAARQLKFTEDERNRVRSALVELTADLGLEQPSFAPQ